MSDIQLSEVKKLKFNALVDQDFDEANHFLKTITLFIDRNLKEKVDYGLIPGCGDKKVLFKPGAEKLCRLFKLRPTFEIVDRITDYKDELFHYHYRCTLYRHGELIAQGDGIANSKESKFNRKVLTCPHCGNTESVKKDKSSDFYYCWKKLGGCGVNNLDKSSVMTSETSFDFNTVNTICKMAQKRSLIAAVVISCGASDYFSQF